MKTTLVNTENKYKLAIIGSRSFNNEELLNKIINEFFIDSYGTPIFDTLVSGGASGADKLGENWAKKWNKIYAKNSFEIKLKIFYPDWDKFGKSAGFVRNRNIIEESDVILAFYDGVSHGTAHSIDLAKKAKKITMIVYF